ncbi:MAG: M42 family metallopeptidase [Oscillospiraceae bacterium]|jgi:putative aminopeptidase FrvX|nr:M42 family metallopeptidase [Oscillospiraceae bacterium]
MIETLKTLCGLSGVSSWEDPVRDYIRQRVEPHADRVEVDALGNLIVFKRGAKAAGNKLMLCAHMDEVGLMVKSVTEEGYLKFGCVGGIDRRILLGKQVEVGERKIPGIIGLKAIHLTTAEERKKVPKLTDLYIDIGAKDKEEALAQVEPGDVCAFVSDAVEFGEGLLKAKAIDDRVGCAVMVKLLEEELPMDCTFVFTAMEEVGTRGAFGAAFSVTPEIALVLEGTTAADVPALEPDRQVCWPGKGPVLSWMDGGTIYDRGLFELLRELAEKDGIPWQMKHYLSGGTDGGAVQRTKAGVRVTGISAAVRYLHAPNSVCSISDAEQMLALARKLIQAVAQA